MHYKWKRNKIRKEKNCRICSVPGRTKGIRCLASAEDRYMAKRSRSYKHPNYENWASRMDELNGRKGG